MSTKIIGIIGPSRASIARVLSSRLFTDEVRANYSLDNMRAALADNMENRIIIVPGILEEVEKTLIRNNGILIHIIGGGLAIDTFPLDSDIIVNDIPDDFVRLEVMVDGLAIDIRRRLGIIDEKENLSIESNKIIHPDITGKGVSIEKDKDKEKSDGSSANYYKLPEYATELQHLIAHKNMNAQMGEIFRENYRYGEASHCSQLRGINKIIFYALAEKERLERLEEGGEERFFKLAQKEAFLDAKEKALEVFMEMKEEESKE